MKKKIPVHNSKLQRLKHAVQNGVNSGKPTSWNVEEIKRLGHKKKKHAPKMPLNPLEAISVATKILMAKYPKAIFGFCAGSIMRGQGTPTSDIDFIVVFPKVRNPYRESFIFDGIPVEAFIHDEETLRYFFKKDSEELHGAIMNMITDSVVVPRQTKLSKSLHTEARKLLKDGPPPLTKEKKEMVRYVITDLIDDLRGGLKKDERFFVGLRLLDKLAEAIQLQSGNWMGFGKHVARRLRNLNTPFVSNGKKAFDALIEFNNPIPFIRLADKILNPFGGRLFDGHRQDAPKPFRFIRKKH
jgi:hypothetical protein